MVCHRLKGLKKTLPSLALALLLALSPLLSTGAQALSLTGRWVRVLVAMEDRSLLERGEAASLGADVFFRSDEAKALREEMLSAQDRVKSEIRAQINPAASFGESFTDATSGFSALVRESDLDQIKAVDGVKEVAEDSVLAVSGGESFDPFDVSSLSLPEGERGEGTLVAVVDTGIDLDNDYFTLSDGADRDSLRYTKQDIQTLTRDGLIASGQIYRSEKIPFAYNYADMNDDVSDAGNHGDVTSAIATGNPQKTGGLGGVASDAQLAFLKVSSNEGILKGQILESAVLAAYEDILLLAPDVVNLSYGTDAALVSFSSGRDLVSEMRKAGILVFAASGNAGHTGAETIFGKENGVKNPFALNPDSSLSGTPAVYSDVVAVGSVESDASYKNQLQIDGTLALSYAQTYYAGEDKAADIRSLSLPTGLVYAGLGYAEDFDKLGKDAVRGKLVVVDRGIITFDEKVTNAAERGAAGVVIINNVEEGVNMKVTTNSVPSVALTLKEGTVLKETMEKKGAHALTGLLAMGRVENEKAGELASSSSWGPNELLDIKPDLAAVGAEISLVKKDGTIDNLSGTSFASPQAAGAAAVLLAKLKKAHPELSAAGRAELAVTLLMNSAELLVSADNGVELSPRAQGAGRVNVSAAANTPVTVTGTQSGRAKIALGDGLNGSFSMSLTVKNSSDRALTYRLSASVLVPSVERSGKAVLMGDTSEPLEKATVTLSSAALKNAPANVNSYAENCGSGELLLPPHSETRVTVSVTYPADCIPKEYVNGSYVEGYVALTPDEAALPALHLPYLGFHGDWNAAPIYDSMIYDGTASVYTAGSVVSQYVGEDGYTAEDVLGLNLFEGENARPSYGNIAISPNDDGNNDFLVILLNRLRSSYTVIDVANEAGEIVNRGLVPLPKTVTDDFSVDPYSIFLDGQDYQGETLPDGRYTVTYSGWLSVDSEEYQSISIPFVVDTKEPELLGASICWQGGRRLLVVKACDNHAVQGARLYVKGKPLASVPAKKEGNAYTMTWDVTGVSLSKLQLELFDYAMNVKKTTLDLLTFGNQELFYYVLKGRYQICFVNGEGVTSAKVTYGQLAEVTDADEREWHKINLNYSFEGESDRYRVEIGNFAKHKLIGLGCMVSVNTPFGSFEVTADELREASPGLGALVLTATKDGIELTRGTLDEPEARSLASILADRE